MGANVGVYTRRMSEIVSATGRVIALEPVPSTFELLAANTADLANVTLIQAAAVAQAGIVRMAVPFFENGLRNHYQASVRANGDFSVVGVELADLRIPPPALVKIDAEGHDLGVLNGMATEPPVPVLIVEDNSLEVVELLKSRGYRGQRLEASPNTVWTNDSASR